MIKRPNKTATKELIWEYVEGIEAENAKLKEGKFDPAAEKETVRKKEVAAKAENLVNRGIVNEVIVDEYNALEERIADMKSEIETLAGITVNVGTFAALIEANNLEIAEVKAIKEEVLTEKRTELAALEQEIKDKKAAWEAENKEYQADLKKIRDREVAEYNYTQTRERAKENDTWEDTKATRLKELDDRETSLKTREDECVIILEENRNLQAKVDAIPELIAEIKANAETTATAQAAKVSAIKEAALRKEVEVDIRLKDAELTSVKSALTKAEEALATKEAELKEAYTKMNELATKTVQASQPVYNVSKESK